MKNKLIIVAGCSGSGKSTVSKTILENFNVGEAQIICLDRFYKKSINLIPKVDSTDVCNYDHPDAFDWQQAIKCISSLLNNKSVVLPSYDYVLHVRKSKGDLFKPTKIIILEGILSMYNKKLNSLACLKIFVDTPLDECFIRRLSRDQKERGRNIKSIIKQWQTAVRPMYRSYIEPTKSNADLILPWDRINVNGLDFLTSAIEKIINK